MHSVAFKANCGIWANCRDNKYFWYIRATRSRGFSWSPQPIVTQADRL